MKSLMTKQRYAQLLQDPRWSAKRALIMDRDGNKCAWCGAHGFSPGHDGDNQFAIPLQVHHKYYDGDRMPWGYPDSALITLCKPCHSEAGPLLKQYKQLLGMVSYKDRSLLREATKSLHPKDIKEAIDGVSFMAKRGQDVGYCVRRLFVRIAVLRRTSNASLRDEYDPDEDNPRLVHISEIVDGFMPFWSWWSSGSDDVEAGLSFVSEANSDRRRST